MGAAAQMFLRAMRQVVRLLAGEPARRWRLRAARPGEVETAGHQLTLAHAALAANWREAVAAAGQFAAALADATRGLWARLVAAAGRARRQVGPVAQRARREVGPVARAARRAAASGLSDATRASRGGLGKAGAALLAAGGAVAARIDRLAERWRDRRPVRPSRTPGSGPSDGGDQPANGQLTDATPSTATATTPTTPATGFRGRSGRILSALGGDRPGTQAQPQPQPQAQAADTTQQLPPAEPTWEEEDNFWWLPSRQAARAQADAEAQVIQERWDEPGPEPSDGTGADDPPSATLG